MRPRDLSGPVATSVFAGLLGAGAVDGLVTLGRAGGGGATVALALGLWGTLGLLAGPTAGLLVAGAASAVPGGFPALRGDERLDRNAAAGVLATLAGLLVLAVGAAAGQALLISHFESARLRAIAAFGMVLIWAPVAAAVALAAAGAARRTADRLPRPGPCGATGLLAAALGAAALLALVAALSRSDWRALDLGPFAGLGAAAASGLLHAAWWYGTAAGRSLGARLPGGALRGAAAAASIACLITGARLPAASPAWTAAESGSLGLRLGVRLARQASDRDGDGHSALFAGGDCDDRKADVFPGAEDVPGDGVDQNCEGGDAKVESGSASAPPGPSPSPHATKAALRGILLVTVDALRADRMGVAGYRRAGKSLTPNLDALAARGAYFTHVWAQAPNTPRSFPSIVTSRYPSEIAWQKQGLNYSPILPSNVTVFEAMAAAGFRPIGIFSHFYFTADRGISQGFAEWSDQGAGTIAESNKDVASPRIVPRVVDRLAKLAGSSDRFVVWTHLFEPHSSYMPHKQFPPSGNESGVPGLMEKYDWEIAFADMWVGKLLAGLEAAGLAGDTAVLVASDHGEAWNEHKQMFHGTDLFDEQLRVPVILVAPGVAPASYDDPVALVDLAPTLLDLAGAPAPAAFRGRSLLPRATGGPPASHPVFAELLPATAWPHHAVMLVDGGKKLIHRVGERRFELYDLDKDPGEKKNLADDPASAETLSSMKVALLAFEERRR